MKRRDFLRFAAVTPCFALGAQARNAFSLANEDAEALPRNVEMGAYMPLQSAFEAFGRGKGDVAFLGGSITEMDGYRPMVCEYLQKTFPKTEFNFVAAGISSTCSDVGAFRLETDVLKKCKKGAPDLFFVEFSVNDDQDGRFSLEHATRGMEGVVRHIVRVNPSAAIVMTFSWRNIAKVPSRRASKRIKRSRNATGVRPLTWRVKFSSRSTRAILRGRSLEACIRRRAAIGFAPI